MQHNHYLFKLLSAVLLCPYLLITLLLFMAVFLLLTRKIPWMISLQYFQTNSCTFALPFSFICVRKHPFPVITFINAPPSPYLMSSNLSLTGLVLAAALSSSGCGSTWKVDSDQCYGPFIYDLNASPEEAYTSDSVVISLYLHNTCASVPILTFPEYDSSVVSSLPGYEVEPLGIEGAEGVVLERTDDEDLVFATDALPLASFTPGYLRYSLTVYGGWATLDKRDTLSDYITLLAAGE